MKSKKVLVIDDEKDLLELLTTRLQGEGFEVTCAFNGKEGLDKAAEWKPDLILLDIMMPEMDGIQTLKVLKETSETRTIPVIMLTCKGETESIFKTEKLGSTDYIIKPFDSTELLSLVKRYI
ncbi:MAG: response regulator [Candidatus Omnitrophica bacterium]|nr:response regulator [Candidatus Omnitrophota bacterium]